MKKVFRWIKYIGVTVLVLIGILLLSATVLYFSADMQQPVIAGDRYPDYKLQVTDSLRIYGPNHLRQTSSGLWEVRIEGKAFERGFAAGVLTEDLLYYQEKVFVDKIREFIPSDTYLKFLRFLLVLFNRNLGEHVPLEFREEIYGISLHCTPEYNAIGTPYERQLNYHAAHDIGHTMQDYMLVGCTSFGVWGEQSEDGRLLIGRNFDFYMGEEFALNKLVSFYQPEEGHRFASVGWAGMTGVLSGMNEKGLTVTINAAQSDPPSSSAMPISLLARQILQYAATIEEAYQIAGEHKTFVSESLLIGSALDGKAVVIEKTPESLDMYDPSSGSIICTNHYQSVALKDHPRNMENIQNSDSPYRYERVKELINREAPLTPAKTAGILRDRLGHGDREIGLVNEKAINQFIAHHAVIFQPEELKMWVSTFPWQSGAFVCYDLSRVFDSQENRYTLQTDSLIIPADSFLQSGLYHRMNDYRQLAKTIKASLRNKDIPEEKTVMQLTELNPELYEAWNIVGDYYASQGNPSQAVFCWRMALMKEIPHARERVAIEKKLNKHTLSK